MEPTTNPDQTWMHRAIAMARRGLGSTRPNPAVGCVIVRDGLVLAEGFHARAGLPHAEAAALAACGTDPSGATMYVTLEPCNHTGRTPPCSEAIIKAGIARVVIGARDPNPQAGGGAERLRAAGVEVVAGVLAHECAMLNPGFHVFHRERRCLVTLKWAMTADGCTSAISGQSKWITGEASRALVHQLRAEHDAVLVGLRTALTDNARLSVRGVAGAEVGPPRRRIVLDSRLVLPPDHPLISEPQGIATIACAESAPADAEVRLRGAGADVWRLAQTVDGRVDVHALLARLAAENCQSVLVEGGRTVAGAFMEAGAIDRVFAFVAPTLLSGGAMPLGALVSSSPPPTMDGALRLKQAQWRVVGDDVLLTGWLRDCCDDTD